MTSNAQVRDAAAQADRSIEDPQGPGRRYSRIFGALFLAGFLVYGIGFGLVSSVITAPDFMSTLAANRTSCCARSLCRSDSQHWKICSLWDRKPIGISSPPAEPLPRFPAMA